MKPVVTDYILAGGDQVSVDAVSSKIMGFNPMSLKYIKEAEAAGLGNGRIENIDIIGEDISNVNLYYTVGDNAASKVGDLLWFGPLKKLQKLMFHTPLVYVFIWASAFYHDVIWYNLKGTKVVKDYQDNTKWGRLFKSYK